MDDLITARKTPGIRQRLAIRFATVSALFTTLRHGPFWFLIPFCALLMLLSVLLILAQVIPAAAPFLYALF
jgi:hypothetical protein